MKVRSILLNFCKATDRVVQIISYIGMALQLIFMILLAVQIFLRYFFNSPIYGIEESVTAMVVWFAAFGTIAVTNANGHAQVEYFLRWFPKKWHKWIQLIVNVVGILMGVALFNGGLRQFKVQKIALPAGGLPFSKCYYYALPIIVMAALLCIVCTSRSIKLLAEKETEREGGDII